MLIFDQVYNLSTNTLTIGIGHTDAILTVASAHGDSTGFVSSGKDQTVCFWKFESNEDGIQLKLVSSIPPNCVHC